MAKAISAKLRLAALSAAGLGFLALITLYFYNQTITVFKWLPLHAYSYSVQFKMSGEQYPNHLLSMNSKTNLDLSGVIRFVTPSDLTGNSHINAYLELSTLDYFYNETPIIKESQKVTELPISIQLNEGQIEHFAVPDEHKYYIDIVRELLTFLDFHQPELLPTRWVSEEKSAQVAYPIEHILNKPWYDSETAMSSHYLPYDDHSSEYEGERSYVFTNSGMSQVKVQRTRKFRMSGELISSDNTEFAMELRSMKKTTSHEPLVFSATYKEDLVSTTQLQSESYLRKKNVLGDDTYEDVLAAMADVTKRDEAIGAARKLVALLTVHPELLPQIIEELNAMELDDLRFGMITSTLQYLGTPEIQKALINEVKQLDNEDDFRRKDKYLTALAFVDKPIDESFDYFKNEFTEVNSEKLKRRSAMAMGVIASRTENPKVKEETATMLIDEYHSDSSDKVVMLRSLSNAGLESTQDFLVNLANSSESNKIASEAIRALRKINTPVAASTLNEFMHSNTLEFREAAVSAYRNQSISSNELKMLGNRLNRESNNAVARNLISVIASYKGDREEAKQVLTDYLNHCSDYKLCNVAESAITSL